MFGAAGEENGNSEFLTFSRFCLSCNSITLYSALVYCFSRGKFEALVADPLSHGELSMGLFAQLPRCAMVSMYS